MFVVHSRSRTPAIALLLSSTGAADLARAAAERLDDDLGGVRPLWLLCSVSGGGRDERSRSARDSVGWRRFFHGAVYVEPYMPELDDFKAYFVQSVQVHTGG